MKREAGKIFVETDVLGVEAFDLGGSDGAGVLGSRGWLWASSREVWWVGRGGEVGALFGVTSFPDSSVCLNSRGIAGTISDEGASSLCWSRAVGSLLVWCVCGGQWCLACGLGVAGVLYFIFNSW